MLKHQILSRFTITELRYAALTLMTKKEESVQELKPEPTACRSSAFPELSDHIGKPDQNAIINTV